MSDKKIDLEKGKALLTSKMFWFNTLSILIMVANLFGFSEFKMDQQTVEKFGTVVAIVNIFLRLKTDQAITKLLP